MAERNVMDVDILRKLLAYDPDTGVLTWLPRDSQKWNKRYAGRPALASLNTEGYRHGSVMRARFVAHRVAWAIYHGEWPEDQIDHINGDRTDNRMCNLRAVDEPTNGRNRRLYKNNRSGVCGVWQSSRDRKWRASIVADGKLTALGIFSSKDEAVAARMAANEKYDYHPNHGK